MVPYAHSPASRLRRGAAQMINSAPAFQLFARDIYTGTSDLSAEEFGVYMRGLVWSWDNGPLPLDMERRARVLLIPQIDLERIWPAIEVNWIEESNGFVNVRLEAQRQSQRAHREAQSVRGKASAAARAKSTVVAPEANRNPTTVESGLQPDANRNPTLHSSLFTLHSSDQKQNPQVFADWFEECKALHDQKCNGSFIHAQTMKMDKLRSKAQ